MEARPWHQGETIEWREAAGGRTFRYVDSGEGPLVLLLHDFPDRVTKMVALGIPTR